MSSSRISGRQHFRTACLLGLWLALLSPLASGLRAAPAEAAGVPAQAEAEPIRSIPEYWEIRGDARDRTHPLRMELTVRYYDPTWLLLWGETEGRPGFLTCAGPLPIRSGQRVLIEGHVVPRVGLSLDLVRISVLEDFVPVEPLPVARRVTDYERFNSRVVVMEGYVNYHEYGVLDHTVLHLIVEGTRVGARLWSRGESPVGDLTGALVRIEGVYVPKHSPAGDALEVDLWVARAEDITVVGQLATDPRFNLPVMPIERVLTLPSRELIRVVGTVHAHDPGKHVIIRDGTGQVQLMSLQMQLLRQGDVIEAIGYPQTRGIAWTLRGAIYRPLRSEATNATSLDTLATLSGPRPPLRLVDQVLALDSAEAARQHAVRTWGIVVWSHPDSEFLFLSDATGGIRVRRLPDGSAPPEPGLAMHVTGTTSSGPYAPEIEATDFEVTGNTGLPAPLVVTLDQAFTGANHSRWIQIRGYLSAVERDGIWARLTVTTSTGEFVARVPWDEALPAQSGSVVRVSGVCDAVTNARRQLTSIQLWGLASTNLQVEEAAPADPFALPLRTIDSLRQFSASPAFNSWARVKGTVTHFVSGRYAFIENESEGLMLLTHQEGNLQAGDSIEVVGLPGLERNGVVLREAIFRQVADGEAPTPVDLGQLIEVSPHLDRRLVRIEGTLVNFVRGDDTVKLAVQNGDEVFDAVLESSGSASIGADWLPGTRLQLTGVYLVEFDESRRPRDFRLQLRAPSDIVVLKRPSWWTPARAVTMGVVLGGLILIGSVQLAMLRRRVLRQTAQIRAQVVKEAALESRHRDIVENASDFIFTTDLVGRFTSFNPAGLRLTGYSHESALKLAIRDLLVTDTTSDNRELCARLLTPDLDGTVTFQSQLKTHDGRLIWVETNARLIRDGDKPAGVLGVVRDISERKQIEEELKRARDAAEANTQSKSAFLANMSHEVRTPMNGVIGMSNLLLDTGLNPEQRSFAETIRNSAEALLTVLNDILDFSKIEAGKMQFETVDFELSDMIEEVLELLAARAAEKRIELVALIAPEVPGRLRGDPGRLRQVLLNLVGNALKFTTTGEVCVHVHLERESDLEAQLRFEITDTGIGMTSEVQARLFQPFTQADNTTTRRFGGTGLGLAISKQIVEIMGGEIMVRSTPGAGSTFSFVLKLEKQPHSSTAPEPPVELAALAGLRVLCVDDNATNRTVLQHFVQGWGLRADMVADALAAPALALAAAEAGDPYRLALLDYQMPDLDGIALAQGLQKVATDSSLPMILLTSVDRRFSREELRRVGIVDLLTKPIRRQELLRAILRVTASPSSTAAMMAATLNGVGPDGDQMIHSRHAGKAVADTPELPPLRILVAEDNVVNQRVIQLQLSKLGCTAEIAANGLEVLEALERSSYDVVLMDCQMPEMDGYEATRCIRQEPRFAGVRVIAMTAHAMQGDRELCLASGMDDYLSKPTRVADVKLALARSVEAGAGRATGNPLQ